MDSLDSGHGNDDFDPSTSNSISFTGKNFLAGRNNKHTGILHTLVGNYNYAPPEAHVTDTYDHTIDWWGVGVLFYHLMAGKTPFEADSKDETVDNIVEEGRKIPWSDDFSHGCRSLIMNLLQYRSKDR